MLTFYVCVLCVEILKVHLDNSVEVKSQNTLSRLESQPKSPLPLGTKTDSEINSDRNNKIDNVNSNVNQVNYNTRNNEANKHTAMSLLAEQNRKVILENKIEPERKNAKKNPNKNEALQSTVQGAQGFVKQSEGKEKIGSLMTSNSVEYNSRNFEPINEPGTSRMLHRTVEKMDLSLKCPMCSFTADSPDTMTVHVNQAHFQDTPVKQVSKKRTISETNVHQQTEKQTDNASQERKSFSNFPFVSPVIREPSANNVMKQCPFCDLEVKEEISLEFHINGCHSDESPDIQGW